MAFDAGMVAAVVWELKHTVIGAKIEKIYQPEKDEISIALRGAEHTRRLILSASPNNPRVCLSALPKENPQTAPQFCMMLRKHLGGAVIRDVFQPDFERAIHVVMEGRDEMGFACERVLICEIMGKCANLIFTDGDGKILSAVKTVDFSTSQLRQILPGMHYEAPPKQDKTDPRTETKEHLLARMADAADMPCDRFLLNHYLGLSPLTAREIAFGASLCVDKPVSACSPTLLYESLCRVMEIIKNGTFVPVLLRDNDQRPLEYSFFPIQQYGLNATAEKMDSFGALIDKYFAGREHADRLHQRARDIFKLLSNGESRLKRKQALQEKELADCAKKESWRQAGNLITGNMYCLKKGMTQADLCDWSAEGTPQVGVLLDARLTPSQNAQKYFKKYNKAKTAEIELTKQMEHTRVELAYIDTVFDALTHAETEADLAEIREELYHSGYASRMKTPPASKKKQYHPMEFRTSGGWRVLCGKNNVQNEYITHTLASRGDYWFHVKGAPGSHAVLFCDGKEPDAQDFTEAAMIAACYSTGGEAKHIAVDYTRVHNLKKVPGAKPGMVIYHTNYSAYVTPDAEMVQKLRVK